MFAIVMARCFTVTPKHKEREKVQLYPAATTIYKNTLAFRQNFRRLIFAIILFGKISDNFPGKL